mgnify:CR=1 FL=1
MVNRDLKNSIDTASEKEKKRDLLKELLGLKPVLGTTCETQ